MIIRYFTRTTFCISFKCQQKIEDVDYLKLSHEQVSMCLFLERNVI